MGDSPFSELFSGFISHVSQRVSLRGVILFGSQARGDALAHSDYDLLVVADFSEKYMDRGKWMVQLTPSVAIDLFAYTPDEFHHKFTSYNITAIDAIDEGIILFGQKFFSSYYVLLEEYKSKGMYKDYRHSVLIPPKLM